MSWTVGVVEHYEPDVDIKHIYILWLQGWDQAPEICKICRESWILKNPGWRVHSVSSRNISRYLDTDTLQTISKVEPIQAQTDLIRLALIHRYGGLYVDATMFCTRALNSWLQPSILVEGIWVQWDYDLPNKSSINFLYSNRAGNPYFHVEPSTVPKAAGDDLSAGSSDYHRVNMLFNKNLLPVRSRLRKVQLFPSSWRERTGVKLMSRGGSELLISVDDGFRKSCQILPYFKLSWKGMSGVQLSKLTETCRLGYLLHKGRPKSFDRALRRAIGF